MIRNKREMVALLREGAFGNRLNTLSFPEWATGPGSGPVVSLRYMGEPGIELPGYGLQINECAAIVRGYEWVNAYGLDPARIIVTPAVPDDRLLIQGEVVRGIRGLEFRYSTAKNIGLRHAMADARTATGLAAKMLLERHLTPSSLEDLYAVMDRWPDHVVELSAWGVEVGDIPGRNAIVWEVRYY